MERIFNLLDNIKDKSGVYIGDKNLQKLSTFLSGYECALYDITRERVFFDSTFQLYVEIALGKNNYGGKHWDGILIEQYSQEDAFDQFYVYLENFKEIYLKKKGQSLYELLFEKHCDNYGNEIERSNASDILN